MSKSRKGGKSGSKGNDRSDRKLFGERRLASIPAGQLLTSELRTLYQDNSWRIYISDNRVRLDHHDPLSHRCMEDASVSWSSMELWEVPFDQYDPNTDWTPEVRFVDLTSPARLSVTMSQGEYKRTDATIELVRNGRGAYATGSFLVPDAMGDALLALFVPALAKPKPKAKPKAAKAA